MIYLASPYSHSDPLVRQSRFEEICLIASKLMREGHLIFCPIAHSHPIAMSGGLPLEFDFWRQFDEQMIKSCHSLYVAQMQGWQTSVGVTSEIAIARAHNKLIWYLDPKSGVLLETPHEIVTR